jgi:hypothetical protein
MGEQRSNRLEKVVVALAFAALLWVALTDRPTDVKFTPYCSDLQEIK